MNRLNVEPVVSDVPPPSQESDGRRWWRSNGMLAAAWWDVEERTFRLWESPLDNGVSGGVNERIEASNLLEQRVRELGLVAPPSLIRDLFDDRRPDALRPGFDYGSGSVDDEGCVVVDGRGES